MKKPDSKSRLLFWVVFGLGAFAVAILLLGFVVGSFLGKKSSFLGLKTQSWEEYQREAEAQGEIFSYARLAPPPVPDDQNFAMTPLLQSIFTSPDHGAALAQRLSLGDLNQADFRALSKFGDWELGQRADLAAWNTHLGQPDILTALKKYDAEMNEISAASRRPFARFPVPYQDLKVEDSSIKVGGGNPALAPLLRLANLFTLRALAELSAGQADRATEDAITILRLGRSVQNEPILISQITSLSIARLGVQVIWEGLAAHGWNDAQLARLQQELAEVDLVHAAQRAGLGERVQLQAMLDQIPHNNILLNFFSVVPQMKISSDRLFNQYVLPTLDVPARRFNPALARAGAQYFNEPPRVLSMFAHADEMPAKILLGIVADSWYGIQEEFAQTQTGVDEAVVACALERHRLAHGDYPAKLDDLAPSFIAALPQDDITGEPLHYTVGADGRFVLYAVGWNETDDHGAVVKDKDGDLDSKQGDWVWQYPAP